jgi:hypothetical protein
MGKLYEILAVEGPAQSRAVKLITETKQVFANKETLFKGKRRQLNLFGKDPAREEELTSLEAKDTTLTKVETTVPDSLNYLGCILGDYWDVMYQKEATNQLAKADIVVDGNVLMKDVPVTFLLCMENRLKDLRPVIEAIPTLAPGIMWTIDKDYQLPYVFRTPDMFDVKTKEDTEYRIVAPATDKHPAQVVPVKAQFNIGRYTTTDWSGLISPAEKARLLEHFDKVLMAVKQSRQRANDVDSVTEKVGDQFVSALFGGWFDRSRMNPAQLEKAAS